MTRSLFILILTFTISIQFLPAQSPGDTIVVNALDYDDDNRDLVVPFPDGTQTYEKIILKYSMRCKDGLVSTSIERNKGCGEWDYSCNTYIVDSSKIEEVLAFHPNYTITGYSGSTFLYTSKQTYDYYRHRQQVVEGTVVDEEVFPMGTSDSGFDSGVVDESYSGQFYFLYTAEELTGSGFSAGALHGINLHARNGGPLPFLKISIAAWDGDTLTPLTAQSLAYQEVVNQSVSLEDGANRILFKEAFSWDGTSALVFRCSYTSSAGQDAIAFDGIQTEVPQCFSANNNYSIDLGQEGRFELDASTLSSVNEALTVSFWSKGKPAFLPANTTILWGYDENPGERDLNIHHPWGNGQIYFDCGYDGGYDRINKTATTDEYEGEWVFWSFTKDAVSGAMRIFKNGEPWHSGSGMQRTITLKHLILGMNHLMTNNYKGEIGELRIWAKALDAETLTAWMHRDINESHPDFTHLMMYYPLSEGQGEGIHDPVHDKSSTGENVFWKVQRGEDIFRGYRSSTVKPAIDMLRGNYNLSVEEIFTIDSVSRSPNIIREYEVISNAGLGIDDEILEITEFMAFEASAEPLLDAETNAVLDIYDVEAEDTLEVINLEYFRRFPFYNEIMSFVTPYGIGLDLGPEGKSWYFDMTDYTPILRGNKRLLITLGGQYQEEMDLDFLFIVGTPPRDVLAYEQIWQGAPRLGSASINAINTNAKFEPRMVQLHPDAEQFKLRSTITGHGSEGEFHQNGGTIFHSIDIGHDGEDFNWSITQECSENPVYPQGGTWVYDRQGWCPGERSLLKEQDLTGLVTPGDTVSIDYQTSNPPNPGGDYRYIVSHQIVAYGAPNFIKDAAIIEIKKPNDNILYSRMNPACDNPVIVVRNTGAEPLTDLTINYWVNAGSEKKTFVWSGDLGFMASEEVVLPAKELFDGLSGDDNTFVVEVEHAGDAYPHNNRMQSRFGVVDVFDEPILLELKTNSRPSENSYTLRDADGHVIASNTLPNANRIYRDTFDLPKGCYSLQIIDTGDDGLEWWANPAQGSGFARFENLDGDVLHRLEPDFGGEITYHFGVGLLTNVEPVPFEEEITLYPNPASDAFVIEGLTGEETIAVYDLYGRVIFRTQTVADHSYQMNTSSWVDGLYWIQISRGNKQTTLPLSVVHQE